jgi:hypothetical protein
MANYKIKRKENAIARRARFAHTHTTFVAVLHKLYHAPSLRGQSNKNTSIVLGCSIDTVGKNLAGEQYSLLDMENVLGRIERILRTDFKYT